MAETQILKLEEISIQHELGQEQQFRELVYDFALLQASNRGQ
jgi:hypothetical protein